MIVSALKTKKILFPVVKCLVLGLTFGYILYKIYTNKVLNLGDFMATIFSKGIYSIYLIITFLLFAAANWYFEIRKWQTLISSFEKIDFKTAMRQSLASLTVSLATPNRIGEYGAKAMFFESQKRKKVLLLNFYSGAMQMLVTCTFGIIGVIFLLRKINFAFHYQNLLIIGLIGVILFVFGYVLKKKEMNIKGFSIANSIRFFKNITSSIKLKTFLFSVLRYLIFSSLFYGLLLFFGSKLAISEAAFLIFTMYFLVSIVPTLFIFDVVIRGGVAVWLFSFAGVLELIVLSTVLAMWILNFVIPSLIGSYYVVTYQPITR